MMDDVPQEPLADWELLLLAEEEDRRGKNEGGDDAGDREPRHPGPRADSGAAALAEPNQAADDGDHT